ncbi:hypothetical protein TNCV_3826381 [Trichonephila clavipes]|nr:hypothetical protein TNCV_3826381 [Trichonephila clavipes]
MSSFLVLSDGDTRNRWRGGQVCPDVGQGTMAPWARRPGVKEGRRREETEKEREREEETKKERESRRRKKGGKIVGGRERGARLVWRKGLSPRLEWKDDERRWR